MRCWSAATLQRAVATSRPENAACSRSASTDGGSSTDRPAAPLRRTVSQASYRHLRGHVRNRGLEEKHV